MSSSAHDSQESSSEEGEPSAQVPPSRETTKRSSGKVRKDHIGQGAFVIEFKNPTAPRNMILSPVQPAGLNPSPSFEGKNRKKVENDYRGMERKGFRVTSDIGCLLPDDRFGTREAGATLKGHQRTFQFFAGWRPRGPESGQPAVVNSRGWPSNLEISHLCHRPNCCRIDHFVAEEKWRNQKRNYCGLNGQCDCGNPVKCLRPYQTVESAPSLCKTKAEVTAVLDGAPPFTIHAPDHYEARDKKAETRRKNIKDRKRKREKHAYETARKQSRKHRGST